MNTLTVGTLAYFDSLTGPIACRVVGKLATEMGRSQEWQIEITARTSRVYPRGSLLTCCTRHLFPRDALRMRSGQYRIAPYVWWQPTESQP